jgi:hypothetical protein
MDTHLSRFWRSMTARPCRSSLAPFDGTISSERVAHMRVQPTAYTRREQRYTSHGHKLRFFKSLKAQSEQRI